MEISSVTLIDGTVFKLDEYRFGGTIKRIYMMYYPNENLDSGWEVYVDITKREKPQFYFTWRNKRMTITLINIGKAQVQLDLNDFSDAQEIYDVAMEKGLSDNEASDCVEAINDGLYVTI